MEYQHGSDASRTPSKRSRHSGVAGPMRSIDVYAAQCENCLKWREITSLEEYEQIRSEIEEKPFVCERKDGVSCEEPPDMDYDAKRVWVIDKPGIPKTPKGFQRSLVLRKDFSKLDAYYITPTGKKMRTRNEVAAFLTSNPHYGDVPLSDFTFQVPKIMTWSVPGYEEKDPPSSEGKKKQTTSKEEVSGETSQN